MALSKSLQGKLIKNYEETPAEKIVMAPVIALRGISEIDAKLLEKHFKIKNIKQLASFKYSKIAAEVLEKASKQPSKKAEVLFKAKISKSYQKKTGKEISSAPIEAIQGVKKSESDFLTDSFGIKSIRQLASFKHVQTALEIIEYSKSSSKAPKSAAKKKPEKAVKKPAAKESPNLKEIKASPTVKDDAKSNVEGVSKKTGIIVALILAAAGLFLLKILTEENSVKKAAAVEHSSERSEKKPAVIEEPKTLNTEESIVNTESSNKVPKPQENSSAEKVYNVQPKDTLGKISRKFFNNFSRWKDIYEINKDQISKPELIYPGQKIRIPE